MTTQTIQLQEQGDFIWAIGNWPDSDFRAAVKINYTPLGSMPVEHLWAKVTSRPLGASLLTIPRSRFESCEPQFGAVQVTRMKLRRW